MTPIPGAAPSVLVIQHEDGTGPGLVGDRLRRAGLHLDVVHPWLGDRLPDSPHGHAGLVVLGGAAGCEDVAAMPWLPRVREMLRAASAEEIPVLGICLGGQILAHTFGGAVAPRPQGPEIGAVLLRRLPAADADPVLGAVPEGAAAAQWHWDEVVRLPPGAVPLLTGDDCPIQAFRVGSVAWGVQFHPEVLADSLAEWALAEGAEARSAGADPEAAVTAVRAAEPELRTVWGAMADAWGALVLAGTRTAS
ncbi:type 1 glutamine amidotransferase [Streptomyces sp. NPDC056527]|uniref:type 1 glutamine amidotransferase n=1 Tax=Streptomyces sp. NPDC056527 TaxID=3345853 RepID=UPI0036889BCF